MRSAFAVFLRGFTLPFGATTGRRIVLDGSQGIIQFFDSANRLRLQLGGTNDATAGQILIGTDHPDESADAQIFGSTIGAGAAMIARMRLFAPQVTGEPTGSAVMDLRSGNTGGTDVQGFRFGNGTQALRVAMTEAANSPMGVATLVAGTVTVNHAWVTANSRIFLCCQTPGGTPGFLRVSARVAGTSFTILSSNAADTSVVAWFMWEPF